jgi:hypothetical protein
MDENLNTSFTVLESGEGRSGMEEEGSLVLDSNDTNCLRPGVF